MLVPYIFGKNFGKHQILPKTSPKKTIEGSVAALPITALVFTALYISGLLVNFIF